MQILGIPETLAAFVRLAVEAEAGEKIAEIAGAREVAKDMQARAPVDTRKLRSSITVRVVKDGAVAAATVPYARFVEFGTRYMDAQPFAAEAADEVGDKIGDVAGQVFKRILR